MSLVINGGTFSTKIDGMKILFVCSANICRSALCQVVLKQKLTERGITGIDVESAGVHDYSNTPRDATMVEYAHKAGYELGGNAIHLTPLMVDSADLIICMENYQVVEIQRRFLPYARWSCLHRFNEICFGEETNLPDPSGDTDYMYSYVFQRVEEGCSTIAWKISKMINDGDDFF